MDYSVKNTFILYEVIKSPKIKNLKNKMSLNFNHQDKFANTIIRFWRKYSSNRCVGCRLLLDYHRRDEGLCHWCYEEENQPVECRYCGSM
jgi:hypothetical protein